MDLLLYAIIELLIALAGRGKTVAEAHLQFKEAFNDASLWEKLIAIFFSVSFIVLIPTIIILWIAWLY